MPKKAQRGDLICILYGCTVPVVLRRRKKLPEDLEGESQLLLQEAVNKIADRFVARKEQRKKTQSERTQGGKARNGQSSAKPKPQTISERWLPILRKVEKTTLRSYQSAAAHGLPLAFGLVLKLGAHPSLLIFLAYLFVFVAFALAVIPFRKVRRAVYKPLRMYDEWKYQRSKKTWRLANPTYYELLGECYVHGIMDGEAMEFQIQNNIRAETFELR